METPPIPKPRSKVPVEAAVPPTPTPRLLAPVKENADNPANTSDILTNLGTKSKQFTEGVAAKISHSAKGTLEKTKTTSRAVRDSVTKSVMEGTAAGMKLLRPKRSEVTNAKTETARSVSMPVVEMNLFENISFMSPLQKKNMNYYKQMEDGEPVCLHLDQALDDCSVFSDKSATNTDYSDSDFQMQMGSELDLTIYDTPQSSRASSVANSYSAPDIPEKKKIDINIEKNRRNSSYENFQLPTVVAGVGATPKITPPENKPRPSQSTIYEFDPLNVSTGSHKYKGVSNELLLLESFLIGDTYNTLVAVDNDEEILEYVENDYFNPPSPPERFDSLADTEHQSSANTVPTEGNSSWYVSADGKDNKTAETEVKRSNSMMQKFSRKLKLDRTLPRHVKTDVPDVCVVEKPSINTLPAPYFSGNVIKTVTTHLVEDLFKTSQLRFCVLSDQKLMCYSDPTNAIIKEVHDLNTISCVQVVLPLSSR